MSDYGDKFSFRIPGRKTVHRGGWRRGTGDTGRIGTLCGRVLWPVHMSDLTEVESSVTFGEPVTCKRCAVVHERGNNPTDRGE